MLTHASFAYLDLIIIASIIKLKYITFESKLTQIQSDKIHT